MEYQEFKERVSRLIGIDLSQYKSQQMDRRIHSFMPLWKVSNYEEYLDVLTDNMEVRQEFITKLTINVSEFFRNPERFGELERIILPELLQRHKTIRIWSAGCSNGAEPYSVAIIAKEMHAESRMQIIATDIDREIVKKAKQGIYNANEIKNLPSHLTESYFEITDNNMYRLNDTVKEMVSFRIHDLLRDPFETEIDLVICRNVVIYFTENAKNVLYEKFIASMRPGGYILVGGTEPILQYRQFKLDHKISSFYQKPLYTVYDSGDAEMKFKLLDTI